MSKKKNEVDLWLAAAASLNEAPPEDTRPFHSTAPANPFLPPQNNPIYDGEEDPDEAEPVMVSGPAAPTGAPAPADPVLQAPVRFDRARAHPGLKVQVVGLHGNAGTSIVASLLGVEAHDCGLGLSSLVDPELPVVLVTMTNAKGLLLLRRAAAQWASGGLEPIRLLGVVLVADAPVPSKALDRETKALERALPHSWRLAWSEDFRHKTELPPQATGGRLGRIRKSILNQAKKAPRASTPRGHTQEGTA